MVGTFKANNPLNTFLLFVYGLLLKFSYFSHFPLPVLKKSDGILYKDLLLGLQVVGNNSTFIYSLITYLLLFTQAVSFNRIVNDQRLLQQSTYLPAMSYLLITSMFPEWNILSSPLLVNSLLIWVCFKLDGLYNSPKPKTTLFNIGMVIGLASFFYFPSLAFSILILLALLINRPFRLSEWVISFTGIVTPFYYFLIWLVLSDNFGHYKLPAISFGYPRFYKNYWQLGAIALLLIALITGAYFVQANLRKQVVQIRKSWSTISFYLILAISIPFVNDTNSFQHWILTAIPLSAFLAACFLYPSKNRGPLLLHWLMVALVIITNVIVNKQ